jgi:hypothetical protein
MRILTFLLALVVGFGVANIQAAPMGEDKIVAVILLMNDNNDKKVIDTIFTTLMAAEKVAKALDIEMSVSDAPIADDVFIFALNSPEQKELTMKMFDEEGYELLSHRVLNSSYKPLDVESLKDGTYIFEVKDSETSCGCSCIRIKRD